MTAQPEEESIAVAKRGPYSKSSKAAQVERRKNFIAAWRTFRGLTQEDAVEATGLSLGTISDIERGASGYSDKSLGKIADALKIEIGMLLSVDPTRDSPFWVLYHQAKPEEREQIEKVTRALISQK